MQNKYPDARFICHILKTRYIENQKVQVPYEIKRNICKYLAFSDVADDAWYTNVYNISSYAK